MEDSQIIDLVLKGDRDAYAELVRSYHSRVYHLCLSMLLSPSEADDAAQDVFLKAYLSLSRHHPNQSFGAWIYRIASNYCLDLLRVRKRQKTDSLDRLTEATENHLQRDLPELIEPADLMADRREKLEVARKALDSLEIEHRQVLILRELEGLSYEQISTTLNCSLDTVKSRLHRARRHLAQKARHFMTRQSSYE